MLEEITIARDTYRENSEEPDEDNYYDFEPPDNYGSAEDYYEGAVDYYEGMINEMKSLTVQQKKQLQKQNFDYDSIINTLQDNLKHYTEIRQDNEKYEREKAKNAPFNPEKDLDEYKGEEYANLYIEPKKYFLKDYKDTSLKTKSLKKVLSNFDKVKENMYATQLFLKNEDNQDNIKAKKYYNKLLDEYNEYKATITRPGIRQLINIEEEIEDPSFDYYSSKDFIPKNPFKKFDIDKDDEVNKDKDSVNLKDTSVWPLNNQKK